MTRTIWPLAIVICTFAIANVIGDDSLIEPRSKLNQTGHNPDQPLPDTGIATVLGLFFSLSI